MRKQKKENTEPVHWMVQKRKWVSSPLYQAAMRKYRRQGMPIPIAHEAAVNAGKRTVGLADDSEKKK